MNEQNTTAFPGSLWPLRMAGRKRGVEVLAGDHSGVGRGAQGSNNEKQTLQLHLDIHLFRARGALGYLPEGCTWVPHGLDGCHMPSLPAATPGRAVGTGRNTQAPHPRRGTVREGRRGLLMSHHPPEPMHFNFPVHHTGATQSSESQQVGLGDLLQQCTDDKEARTETKKTRIFFLL